jgi:hypothetical protein
MHPGSGDVTSEAARTVMIFPLIVHCKKIMVQLFAMQK